MGIITKVMTLCQGIIYLGIGTATLPLSVFALILRGRPLDILSKSKISEMNFTLIWRVIGKPAEGSEDQKRSRETVSQAHGVVLDLGPGTGATLCHFDKPRITKIYGVEPNLNFHPALRTAITAAGLDDVYTIIPTGVENLEELKKYGIEEGSVDCIVACKVLCSVPEPKKTIGALYRILAPGGLMLVYEHVKAKSGFAVFVQDMANTVWPFLMAGCNIQRPTEAYLYGAGDWEEKDLKAAEGFTGDEFITFTHGKLVKAK
ncbi:hypothetical protein TWF694_011095 [Orbilia ellipsospora]|uniref:Methyltransferase type 11 domain-containing protein n=1 Tax=Orbilia ellipsospora TaxID=2528407 RepID=A0AAV9XAK1_9PEZI